MPDRGDPESFKTGTNHSNWFPIWYREAKYEKIDFDTVLSDLGCSPSRQELQEVDLTPEDEDEKRIAFQISDKRKAWPYTVLYQWTIEPGEGEFTVTENICRGYNWLLIFTLMQFGISFLLWVLPSFESFTVEQFFGGIIVVIVSVMIPLFIKMISGYTVEKPLDTSDKVGSVTKAKCVTNLYLTSICFIFPFGIFCYISNIDWIIEIVALIITLFALFTLWKYNDIAESYIHLDYHGLQPSPSLEYVTNLFAFLLPVLCIGFGRLTGIPDSLSTMFLAAPSSLFLMYVILNSFENTGDLEFKMFRQSGTRYVSNRAVHAVYLCLSIALAYFGVLAAIWLVQDFLEYGGLYGYTTAVIVLMPLGYFWIGILSQPVQMLLQLRTIQAGASPASFSVAETVDCDVQVSSNGVGPLAYSTGLNSSIVIPESAVELLDEGELRAVLAHEEAHIKGFSDALIRFLTPLISLPLLIGQNVIYAFLDFREREFQADRYAAEMAGEQNLVSALRTLEEESHRTDIEDYKNTLGFTPFIPLSSRSSSYLPEDFHVFFGGFALSKAHPSIEERISQFESENW